MSSVRSHTSTIIETPPVTDDAHPVVDEKKPAFDPFLVKWEEGEAENPQVRIISLELSSFTDF